MTDWPSAKRRYRAAWLPFLPAERAGAPPDAPLVLVERVRGAMRLAHVSPGALALGLTPGLALADARARVPEIDARELDRHGDRRLLERVAGACERFTPMVAIDGDDAVVLDLTGCAAAPGLAALIARFGLTIRIADGATAEGALALARHGGDDLHALPVSALGIGEADALALRRAGLKTIGHLAERPRAPLAARFGKGLVTRLARLLGEEDARITPRRVPPPVRAERRFAEPIAKIDYIIETIGQLIREAGAELERRGQGGRRFAAALFRSDGAVRRLAIETGAPTRDMLVLLRLFEERIAALSDPIDPGFGFDMVRLSIERAEPLAPASPTLDGDAREGAKLEALVDRLSTRLDRERVIQFAPVDSHIPEQAALELPAIDPRPARAWPKPEVGEPPLRPLHLFDPPQPVQVTADTPDGPPAQFRWRRALHIVALSEGPERIAAEWWTRKDGGGLTRDYYRVEDVRGRRFWLFRHGLYAEKPDPRWYLHGLFA